MSHHCHAAGCTTEGSPKLLMCYRHWCMVPRHLQQEIWHAYRHGQEKDKRITHAYAVLAAAAVRHVARREGRSDDAIRQAIRVYEMLDPDRPRGLPHRWETVPPWPAAYLPGQAVGMPRRAAYDRCADCCVSRTPATEHDTCARRGSRE